MQIDGLDTPLFQFDLSPIGSSEDCLNFDNIIMSSGDSNPAPITTTAFVLNTEDPLLNLERRNVLLCKPLLFPTTKPIEECMNPGKLSVR